MLLLCVLVLTLYLDFSLQQLLILCFNLSSGLGARLQFVVKRPPLFLFAVSGFLNLTLERQDFVTQYLSLMLRLLLCSEKLFTASLAHHFDLCGQASLLVEHVKDLLLKYERIANVKVLHNGNVVALDVHSRLHDFNPFLESQDSIQVLVDAVKQQLFLSIEQLNLKTFDAVLDFFKSQHTILILVKSDESLRYWLVSIVCKLSHDWF